MSARAYFLTGVAALLMVTGTAHAATPWTHTGEENCVVVRKTSDGFLAVRDKPSIKGKIIATLHPKFPLTVSTNSQFLEGEDYKLYKNWKRWTRVKGWFSEQDADPSWGWVYSKYIKKVPCEEPEDDSADYEASKRKEQKGEQKLDIVRPEDTHPKDLKPPVPDEILADWCKRNDPDTKAESCIELKSNTHIEHKCYPRWTGIKRC